MMNARSTNTTMTEVMGILNLTPDSFFDGGKYNTTEAAVQRCEVLLAEGAKYIDIGAESTRPFDAEPLSLEEEWARLAPVISSCRGHADSFGAKISVDTYKAEIAKRSIDAGADMINDVSGLSWDEDLFPMLGQLKCPVVLTHSAKDVLHMQSATDYSNILGELSRFFSEATSRLHSVGVKEIIIDPGIGFGKSQEANIEILANLDQVKALGYPVLVGVSRKSVLGYITGRDIPDRGAATVAVEAIASQQGVSIIRTHDVAAAVDAIKVAKAIKEKEGMKV